LEDILDLNESLACGSFNSFVAKAGQLLLRVLMEMIFEALGNSLFETGEYLGTVTPFGVKGICLSNKR
jgi:hypothetical protein